METTQKVEVGKVYRTALQQKPRSIDEANRTIDFVASTPTPDRYGDSIPVEAWHLDNYRNNPLFLFSHKADQPPIGRCVKIWTEQSPPALCQTIQFADYDFATLIFNLYKDGFMHAVSVGFLPLAEPALLTDLEDRVTGYEFPSVELLELSAVNIPAQPEALARMVQKGFSETDIQRAFSGTAEFSTTETLTALKNEIAALKQEIATLKMPPRQESADVYTSEQLVEVVKQAGDSIRADKANRPSEDETISTFEQLGASGHEIETLDELGEAVGESIISLAGSRKWRDVGRLALNSPV